MGEGECGERVKDTDWTRTSATPPHNDSPKPCSQNGFKGLHSLSFIFSLSMSTGCPVRHLTFDMSKVDTACSLTPGLGCQPQGVIPRDKDAFPCAWGAITCELLG